jgi:hypothetical protein
MLVTRPRGDFSRKRKRVVFTADGDEFIAYPSIPAEVLIEWSLDNKPGETDRMTNIRSFFEMCLQPDSYAQFNKRLSDPTNPLDLNQCDEISDYLMEEYGMRPVKASDSSSTGLDSLAGGTSSTVNVPPADATSES